MSDMKSNPPKRAIWLLQHACPGDNEALTGDLIERFREGETRGWWQVVIACAVGVLVEIRQHWPYICYAIAGTAAPHFFWKTVEGVPGLLRWWTLPWPYSPFVFEESREVLLALVALPVLAVALVINLEFRWVSLLRTGVINVTLVVLGKYLLSVLAAIPLLQRPTDDPHTMRILMMPPPLLELMFFSSFLLSAWLGCVPPRKATRTINSG